MRLLPIVHLVCSQLAPLEPANGVILGTWLDTAPGQDTPRAFNERLGYNAGMFMLAEDFPLDFNKPPPVELIDATGTNAIYYLTVYPNPNGFNINDNDINELVKQVAGYTNRNRQVMLRLAPEMNGNWFPWGQRPVTFIRYWRAIVTAMRANPLTTGKVAFVWAPNPGRGYPCIVFLTKILEVNMQ
jgi:hypothetical protein